MSQWVPFTNFKNYVFRWLFFWSDFRLFFAKLCNVIKTIFPQLRYNIFFSTSRPQPSVPWAREWRAGLASRITRRFSSYTRTTTSGTGHSASQDWASSNTWISTCRAWNGSWGDNSSTWMSRKRVSKLVAFAIGFINTFLLLVFKDLIMKKCFNEVDNASNPGMIYKLLLECSTPSLVEGIYIFISFLLLWTSNFVSYLLLSTRRPSQLSDTSSQEVRFWNRISGLLSHLRLREVPPELQNLDATEEAERLGCHLESDLWFEKSRPVSRVSIFCHKNWDYLNFRQISKRHKIWNLLSCLLDALSYGPPSRLSTWQTRSWTSSWATSSPTPTTHSISQSWRRMRSVPKKSWRSSMLFWTERRASKSAWATLSKKHEMTSMTLITFRHLMFTLTLGNFLSLFDLMDPGDQLALSKRILDQLLGDDDQLLRDLKDPLHIMALIRLCEVQANSINALSIQGNKSRILGQQAGANVSLFPHCRRETRHLQHNLPDHPRHRLWRVRDRSGGLAQAVHWVPRKVLRAGPRSTAACPESDPARGESPEEALEQGQDPDAEGKGIPSSMFNCRMESCVTRTYICFPFSSRPAWLMFTSRSRPYRTCSSSSVWTSRPPRSPSHVDALGKARQTSRLPYNSLKKSERIPT